jgi:predicted TIM-barrel fold metal-dependent hydrolase
LAACPLLYDASTYQKLINAVGFRKVLWGTDYPLRVYPSKLEKPNFISFLQQFKDSVSANHETLDCMLGKNLRSLLK